MFFPRIHLKDDPVRRWHRPDRHYFANGACQVLAFAFLERYPDMGFHARWVKPAAGFTGNHIYVTDGINAFDLWWIYRPTRSFPNIAPGRSTAFGYANPDNSSMTRCHARARLSRPVRRCQGPPDYRVSFLYFTRCGMMLSWPSRRILSFS